MKSRPSDFERIQRRMARIRHKHHEDIDEDEIRETRTLVARPSTARPSLVGEAASFLTRVAVRAAQNYAAYCLEEWIAPRRVQGATKGGALPPSDNLALAAGRNMRPERGPGRREQVDAVLVGGGFRRE